MKFIDPFLHHETLSPWSGIEQALNSGQKVELVIPPGGGGKCDALKVGNMVIRLPDSMDLPDGTTIVLKLSNKGLAQQGELEIVDIFLPKPKEEVCIKSLIQKLDMELIDTIFKLNTGRNAQVEKEGLGGEQRYCDLLSLQFDDPEHNTSTIDDRIPLKYILQKFIISQDNLKNVVFAIKENIESLPLKSLENLWRQFLSNHRERLTDMLAKDFHTIVQGSININLTKDSKEINNDHKLYSIKLAQEAYKAGGGKISIDVISEWARNICSEIAADISYQAIESEPLTVLKVFKELARWLGSINKDEVSAKLHISITKLIESLERFSVSLNSQELTIDLCELYKVIDAIDRDVFCKDTLLKDEGFISKKGFKLLAMTKNLILSLPHFKEHWESSKAFDNHHSDGGENISNRPAESVLFEFKNRIIDHLMTIETLNSHLYQDGSSLFCWPLLFKGRLNLILGEFYENEVQEDIDREVEESMSSVRPDIRFEVEFSKIGRIMGLIYLRRQVLVLYFDNMNAISLCEENIEILQNSLGKEWACQVHYNPYFKPDKLIG
jgi:hypothetical protein